MNRQLVVILDIGKTNAKLLQIDADSGNIAWNLEYSYLAAVQDGYRQLPLAALESWLWRALQAMPDKAQVSHLVPVTHGAAAVLLERDGTVLAAPDYEDAIFESTRTPYEPERDDFATSGSPLLPLGLNLGRQLYFLQQERAVLTARCTTLLLYPQYWSWKLCGALASEVTSLGCHTDLWLPGAAHYSRYATRSGWAARLPPLRRAGESLGTVSAEAAARCGLPAGCQVLCGIHDSNAAYYAHRAARGADQPFAVVSSGTWVIAMAHGADLSRLEARRDMLANVDALGAPVATARFMGGREYAAITGATERRALASSAALPGVMTARAMALPSFVAGSGPFPDRVGELRGAERLDAAERSALATLYLALMCELRLDELGARGDVIIDGPLASDALFSALLAALLPDRSVLIADSRAGIVHGALRLALAERAPKLPDQRAVPLAVEGLRSYRRCWRQALN